MTFRKRTERQLPAPALTHELTPPQATAEQIALVTDIRAMLQRLAKPATGWTFKR